MDIVYTPYPNLKKTGDMVAGQVGFHKNKKVIKINIEKNNEVCWSYSDIAIRNEIFCESEYSQYYVQVKFSRE